MEREYDIFISYAHIDNQAPVEGKEGWVSTFHRALAFRVSQLLGQEPKIWRDPKLQGNDVFADTLVDELSKTNVLVSILSPRYVKSDWCRRELHEFVEAAEKHGGGVIGNKSRVFKVVKTPVPPERHPPEAQALLGYEFFTVDPQTGRPHEMLQIFGPEAEKEFWLKLDDLALDVTSMLEQLHENGNGSEAPADGAPAEGLSSAARATIYLADSTADLREQRDAIKRDLEQHGYKVLPDQMLPTVAADLEESARAALAVSKMSLHLVGASYGLVPEGTTRSTAALQYEAAVERNTAGDFPLLIWMPAGTSSDDERQQEFLELLRTDPRTTRGADLLETPFEDFKTVVHQTLEPPQSAANRAPEAPLGGDADSIIRVYLLCDQRDVDTVDPLVGLLFDKGCEVTLPIFEGDEAEIRQDHEANLRLCDAVLIYYGDSNDLWLRKKLRELQKIPSMDRAKQLLGKAIWVGAPETPQKQRLRTREAMVIESPTDFSEQKLQPFLDALGA